MNIIEDRIKSKGISLRTLHNLLIIFAVVVSAVMIIATFHFSKKSSMLAEISAQQVELRKVALDLMDASDYLTDNVQRFTIYGDMRFLENYFTEAFDKGRREKAVKKMSTNSNTKEALYYLKNAMEISMNLMNREYYAMRLVIDALGYTDYPDLLKSIEISPADASLSRDEKIKRAVDLVHNDGYGAEKEQIKNSVTACLSTLQEIMNKGDEEELSVLDNELNIIRIIIVVQTLGIFFFVWLTSKLGIHPVLKAVTKIMADSPIPESGSKEFRYLACTYNRMYEVYKNSLDQLNFKASHDELTGAYNRFGLELLMSSVDLSSTYVIMSDVDNFKTINDTYGHDIGDKILIKVVQSIKKHFRADDYLCRLGGDEFVVLAVHVSSKQDHHMENKITLINQDLSNTEDGLPATSISAGIVRGDSNSNFDSLLREADEALYTTKNGGKHGCSFYRRNAADKQITSGISE